MINDLLNPVNLQYTHTVSLCGNYMEASTQRNTYLQHNNMKAAWNYCSNLISADLILKQA